MKVDLTEREIRYLLSALRISGEDGSIYGAAYTPKATAKVNAELEAIEAKLKSARTAEAK